jgi:hypothetical protein
MPAYYAHSAQIFYTHIFFQSLFRSARSIMSAPSKYPIKNRTEPVLTRSRKRALEAAEEIITSNNLSFYIRPILSGINNHEDRRVEEKKDQHDDDAKDEARPPARLSYTMKQLNKATDLVRRSVAILPLVQDRVEVCDLTCVEACRYCDRVRAGCGIICRFAQFNRVNDELKLGDDVVDFIIHEYKDDGSFVESRCYNVIMDLGYARANYLQEFSSLDDYRDRAAIAHGLVKDIVKATRMSPFEHCTVIGVSPQVVTRLQNDWGDSLADIFSREHRIQFRYSLKYEQQ